MFGNYYNPYQPQIAYPQPMPDNLAQLRQPQQSITWVQGEGGAKAYPVGAGNSVLLMDSDGSSFYLKSADASGMPTLRVFDYVERTAKPPVSGSDGFKELADRVSAIEDKIASMCVVSGKEDEHE